MDWITGIQKAIDYTEDHLEDVIDFEKVRNRLVRQVFSFKGFLRLFVESVLVNIFVTDGFPGQQKFLQTAMQRSLMWHSDSAMKLLKVLHEPLPVFMGLLPRKQKVEGE